MPVNPRFRMRHMRCFLTVAQSGSVTAAAEVMHSSQPAISRSLAELEEQIGRPLFVRTGRGLVLTEAGDQLRRHLETAMSQIAMGTEMAKGKRAQPKVSVGMLPNVARTLAVDAAATFKTQEPHVVLSLQWTGVSELQNSIIRNDVDFVLGRHLSLDFVDGVSFEHLYSEALVFVVHKDHPLAARPDAASLDDLQDELMIVPLPETVIRRELDKFLAARGFGRFASTLETVSFEFTRAFLRHNRAVGCVPMGAVRREIADGWIVPLGISGEELVSSVGMTYPNNRPFSPEADRFADHVRRAAQQFL